MLVGRSAVRLLVASSDKKGLEGIGVYPGLAQFASCA
jgi:hypothetical protein